jgi:NAD(P)-dependent dehydrogenase (short-subunit alcohol dehydrogenase family)
MAAQKVALITAGTAGLGAAIARVLAPDFRVVCSFQDSQQYTQPNLLMGDQLRKQQLPR